MDLLALCCCSSATSRREIATRKIDVQDQLNKGNTAVAIVVAALLLGIAYIAGLVVHG